MTFGEALKGMRQGKGLTQAGLAEAADIPLGTIRDYEQSKREPLLSNAQRLARALDVSLDEFPSLSLDRRTEKPPAKKPRKRK